MRFKEETLKFRDRPKASLSPQASSFHLLGSAREGRARNAYRPAEAYLRMSHKMLRSVWKCGMKRSPRGRFGSIRPLRL
jgi:hypothetical protein